MNTRKTIIVLALVTLLVSSCGLSGSRIDTPVSSEGMNQETRVSASRSETNVPAQTLTPSDALTTPVPFATNTVRSVETAPPDIEPNLSVTPTSAERELSIFTFSRWNYYNEFSVIGGNIRWSYQNAEIVEKMDASFLTFSHFEDSLVYFMKKTGQVVLDNLSLSNSLMLYKIEEQVWLDEMKHDDLWFRWLPDDRYVIMDPSPQGLGSYLIDTLSGEVIEWPYDCNQLALTPDSDRISVWCSYSQKDEFAVFDWGKGVAYSQTSPKVVIAQRSDPPARGLLNNLVSLWGWSSNGQWVAYFDSSDERGALQVKTVAGGEMLFELEDLAYWLTLPENIPAGLPPSEVVHWSQDGHRLIIYGKGSYPHVCPNHRYENVQTGEISLVEVPCWQVVDVDSQEIIWSVGDLIGPLYTDMADLELYEYHHAAISPNGEMLLLSEQHSGEKRFYVIDISTGDILSILDLYLVEARWFTKP